MARMRGTTRSSSSCSVHGVEPGRVDIPPMSRMSGGGGRPPESDLSNNVCMLLSARLMSRLLLVSVPECCHWQYTVTRGRGN